MYTIDKEILFASYVGNIEERKLTVLMNTLAGAKERVENRQVKGVVLSLKSALYDSKTLKLLIQKLQKITTVLGIPVALCDYSAKTYVVLKALTEETPIRLFKTPQSARLFFAPKTLKKNLNILVYDEDAENMDAICTTLVRQGYSVQRAKNEEDFKNRLGNGYDIAITQCRLNSATSKPTKSALPLSRVLISNLPVFMDTAVETLVSYTGMEAKKTSHQIQSFTTKIEKDVISAMMFFKGDVQGHFVLVFPRALALKTIEAMLGEEISPTDNAAIMDGIGELCNIITGSAKTKLSKSKISVVFDLPKTYTSIQSLISVIGQENGIWIDMQLEGNPFYMFVSR
jgi:CheY-specific phosphatase CheX